MEVDRPLTRDQVVETRVGADRVRVCRSGGADRINLFLRPRARSRAAPLTSPAKAALTLTPATMTAHTAVAKMDFVRMFSPLS